MFGSLLVKILSSGVLDKLLDYYKTKDDNKTTVVTKEIEAELEARKEQNKLLKIEHGWWVTAWIRPLFVYTCLIHFGAIVLDSVFRFSWSVDALPSPYTEIEAAIILSYFVGRPFEKGYRLWQNRRS